MGAGLTRKRNLRAQSSLDYLVTYGWVFIIIVAVIAGLYYLNVFNPTTYAVRGQPGACQVSRPNGVFTTQLLSLAGACSNLIPEYVAGFTGATTQQVVVNYQYFTGTNFTITGWVYYAPGTVFTSNYVGWLWSGQTGAPSGSQLGLFATQCTTSGCNPLLTFSYGGNGASRTSCSSPTIRSGQWYFESASWNSVASTLVMSLNGTPCATVGVSPISITDNLYIGGSYGSWGAASGSAMNGYLANVQIYNRVLTSTQLTSLYKEGVGGEPISVYNLMGWWPLNGDSNDYSGNNNNGNLNPGISFQSGWTYTYVSPP